MMRFLAMLVLLAASTTAVRADSHLADFSLPDVDGKLHRLSDHRGKWVVINFWATWCGPCMVEIPELIGFHERHKDDDAIVIGVNFEQIETSDLVKFIDEMGINYLVVRAGDKPILPFEPLKGLPSTSSSIRRANMSRARPGRWTRRRSTTFSPGRRLRLSRRDFARQHVALMPKVTGTCLEIAARSGSSTASVESARVER